MIAIETADARHLADWAGLRAMLWPDDGIADHRAEIAALLAADDPDIRAFVAIDGGVIGFAEAALRHDYVNGCDTSPVCFLEGIAVAPTQRGRGVARALAAAVADWGRRRGCTEMASDADIENAASHAFHAAIGFAETERVVYFRAAL